MKIRVLFFGLIATMSTLMFSSCCNCKQAALLAAKLNGPEWTLIEYQGRPFKAEDNYKIIFNGEENTASGVADCNSFVSDFKADNNGKIKVVNKALTRALCQNDKMEQSFLDMLQQADSYSIDGNLLLWLKNGECLGIFEAKDFVADKKQARKALNGRN